MKMCLMCTVQVGFYDVMTMWEQILDIAGTAQNLLILTDDRIQI